MKLAFAIFKYFPFGGLQSDMKRIADEAIRRGHRVTVFTTQWDAPAPDNGMEVRLLHVKAWSNPGMIRKFQAAFLKEAVGFDRSVAFNRFGGCQFYFAADNCLAVECHKKYPKIWLALNPRYRTLLAQEKEVFCPYANTRILHITQRQKQDFIDSYGTQPERFFYIPPGMNELCRRPDNADKIRLAKRQELGLDNNQLMLILVGSNFNLKGGDRVLRAVASLPQVLRSKCRLFFVGQANPDKCAALAAKLGLLPQLTFTGGRRDVPQLLLAADLMVHPARNESAGSVLIEAIAAGLPVICSEECGFSTFVKDATDTVVPLGTKQEDLDRILSDALSRLPELAEQTRSYAKHADFYRRAQCAVDIITSD